MKNTNTDVDTETNTKKVKSPQFKDVTRYTRWINNLDRQDEGLSPVRRKAKWLLFMGILLLSFILSFILFPAGKPDHDKLSGPVLKSEQPAHPTPPTSPFEMPTDSFENLLKQQIDENNLYLPEKE